MTEKIMVEFTKQDFDKILEYQKEIEADTIQEAIIKAICIGHLKDDFKFAIATVLASAT